MAKIDTVVFAGAGASKPFGIPTMQELYEQVKRTINDDGPVWDRRTLNLIESALKNSKFTPDLENLLSVIDGLRNPEEEFRRVGPLVSLLMRGGIENQVSELLSIFHPELGHDSSLLLLTK